MINKRDRTNYTPAMLLATFKAIVDAGLRPSLPKRTTYDAKRVLSPGDKKLLAFAESFQSALEEDRRKGAYGIGYDAVRKAFCEERGVNDKTLTGKLHDAAAVRRKLTKWEKEKQAKTDD